MDDEHDKLDFHQAMQDFRVMFPSLDNETIEAVLRANQGAVDDTIDQLLALTLEGITPEQYAESSSGHHSKICDTINVADLSTQPSAQNLLLDFLECPGSSVSVSPNNTTKKTYQPPFVGKLPKNFLRPDYDTVKEERRRSLSPSYQNNDPPPQYSKVVNHRSSAKFNAKPGATVPRQKTYTPPVSAHLGIFSTRPLWTPSPYAKRHNSAIETALKKQSEIFKERLAENDWRRHLNDDPELERYLEDERVALMLQNDEFLMHLKTNPDFIAALEKDQRKTRKHMKHDASSTSAHTTVDQKSEQAIDTSEQVDEADPFPYTKILPKNETLDVPFAEKLKYMSKNSKRKFAILARKFMKKKKGAKGIIGNSESSCSDVGLLGNTDSEALIDGEDSESENNAGYNQSNDDSYNIGQNTDLKEGRLFSAYR